MTIRELASLLGGTVIGDGAAEIARTAKIEEAGPGDIAFLSNPKYARYLETTRASAVLVGMEIDCTPLTQRGVAAIVLEEPYVAFGRTQQILAGPVEPLPEGIHPTAVLAPGVRLGEGVALGAYAVLEEGVAIGDRTRIGAHVVVGKHASLGTDCRIYPNVTIYHGTKIDNRVVIHSGAVIGSDGFGFAPKKDGTFEKIPQMGIVHIEDDVELGANLCIDRGSMGETLICRGVKLDNLIQIGHNCVVGENTVAAALTGMAGSSKVGKNVMLGGNVGLAGHLEVADRTILMARSAIAKSITVPGQTWFGAPAKEAKRAMRIEAVIRSLPELAQQIADLQHRLQELEQRESPGTDPADR